MNPASCCNRWCGGPGHHKAKLRCSTVETFLIGCRSFGHPPYRPSTEGWATILTSLPITLSPKISSNLSHASCGGWGIQSRLFSIDGRFINQVRFNCRIDLVETFAWKGFRSMHRNLIPPNKSGITTNTYICRTSAQMMYFILDKRLLNRPERPKNSAPAAVVFPSGSTQRLKALFIQPRFNKFIKLMFCGS